MIDEKIRPGVDGVVFIVPGRKNASPIYKDLKKYMLVNCPVAS